jgi:hypothetical protein
MTRTEYIAFARRQLWRIEIAIEVLELTAAFDKKWPLRVVMPPRRKRPRSKPYRKK